MSVVLRVKEKTSNVSKLLPGSLYMLQRLFLVECGQKIKSSNNSRQAFLLWFVLRVGDKAARRAAQRRGVCSSSPSEIPSEDVSVNEAATAES